MVLAMPNRLILVNVPDTLLDYLKFAAVGNQRSVSQEVVARLEAALAPRQTDPAEHLARARQLRATLAVGGFEASDIDAFKQASRA